MIRTVFALMAGLLCALAGGRFAVHLKEEAVRLNRWTNLLQHLSLLLGEAALPLPEALCAAADTHHKPDAALRQMAAEIQEAPLTTLEEAWLHCCGDWQEKETLRRMFAHLGHGSRDSRLLAVTQAAKETALLAHAADAAAQKDVKLWQTLGLIGGICLTILLL